MNKSEIYIALQQKVEMVAGRNMNTPRDFDYLSTLIFDRAKFLHDNLPTTTPTKNICDY